jgi:murein DD-endopeptidase MepM/ murein hydrolase activator NlpD
MAVAPSQSRLARLLRIGVSAGLSSTLVGAGCAAGGLYHRVGTGETLYRIGKAYGIPYRDLARVNDIEPPYTIQKGSRLFIPGADRQLPVTTITPRAMAAARPKSAASGKPTGAASSVRFVWPARGKVTSSFGRRGPSHHDGIDISAPRGTEIRAARDGKVIFSDRLSGYGNVIIVEHGGGFASVYAHNDRNLVRTGSRIRAGQKIGTVGATGRTSGPHLHFEIRKDNVARDPLWYLPSSTVASAGADG